MSTRFLLSILVALCCTKTHSQSTYFKGIELFDGNYSTGPMIELHNGDIYMSGSTIAIQPPADTFLCMHVAKLTTDGEVLWERLFPWTSRGNFNSLICRGDTVFVCGDNVPLVSQQQWHFLMLTTNGDSIMHRKFDYATDSLTSVFTNGMVMSGTDVYMYGQTRTASDNLNRCVIQRYNYASSIDSFLLLQPDTGRYLAAWEAAVDTEGNILLINEVRELTNTNGMAREILKLSPEGHVLDRLYGPRSQFSTSVNSFMLLQSNGNYFFQHHLQNEEGEERDIPMLISMTPSGNFDWILEYEKYWLDDDAGIIEIYRAIEAACGDILLTGRRFRRKNLGTGYDIYLARISPDGDILWEHFYNTIEDPSVPGEYDDYFSFDLVELPDASILVSAFFSKEEQIIWLKVDPDGCLEGYNCGEDIVLTDSFTNATNTSYYHFPYPNPTSKYSTILLRDHHSGSYTVYDAVGQPVRSCSFRQKRSIEIDLSDLQSGTYIVEFVVEDEVFSTKIVKH